MTSEGGSCSNSRSSTYSVLSNEQTRTSQKFYDGGMISTASNMHGLIEEAAGEASITVDLDFKLLTTNVSEESDCQSIPD